MARNRFSARRIPNGTYGSVWVDGERLAECYGCQGKVAINSDKINPVSYTHLRLTTAMRQKYQDHLAAQRAEETANETASRALARLRALAHF